MSDNAATGTCGCGRGSAIGVSHVDATRDLGMGGGNLMFKLRVSLSETFGNNVIYMSVHISFLLLCNRLIAHSLLSTVVDMHDACATPTSLA